MENKESVKVGIIGLGRMGRNHLRILSLLANVDIKFIYDLDIESAKNLANDYGLTAIESLEEELKKIDAVIIASPTTTHLDHVLKASEYVKNIFVEKPIADTLENTLLIEKVAASKQLNLQVGFIERFNPAVEQVRKLVENSEQVVSVDFTRTNKLSSRITDVDVITDLMIHDIDLALYLNGPISSVVAHGVIDSGMIGYASALLNHVNGRFSRIQASRITDKKIRSIQATCTDMFIDCELLRKEITISKESVSNHPEGEPYRITGIEEKIEVQPREALQQELLSFLASCRGEDDIKRPKTKDGVDAMTVCDEIAHLITSSSLKRNRA